MTVYKTLRFPRYNLYPLFLTLQQSYGRRDTRPYAHKQPFDALDDHNYRLRIFDYRSGAFCDYLSDLDVFPGFPFLDTLTVICLAALAWSCALCLMMIDHCFDSYELIPHPAG